MKKIILLSLCWASILPAMENLSPKLKRLKLENDCFGEIVDSVAHQVIQEVGAAPSVADIEKNHLRIMALFASGQYTDALSKTLNETFKRLGIDLRHWFGDDFSSEKPYPLTAQIMCKSLSGVENFDQETKNKILIQAVWLGYIPWVHKLIQVGADIDKQDQNGNTALILAAKKGHTDIVQALLNADADLDKQNKSMRTSRADRTALMYAVENRHLKIVNLLINKNADLNKQDACKNTALMWAGLFGYQDIMHALIKAGADVDIQNSDIESILMHAVIAGHLNIVQDIIDAHGNVDIQNYFGDTPLTLATQDHRPDINIMHALIKAGADVNIQTSGGYTALMWGAYWGNKEIINILLDAGTNVALKNNENKTALDIAKEKGHTDIVELLEQSASAEAYVCAKATPHRTADRAPHRTSRETADRPQSARNE